jgi:predicted homoserine dehydrogenase-like protein
VTSFADATKLSMESTVLANATGFQVGRRGMYGPSCANVREMADRLPPEDLLGGGIVDYALGAAPHTGAFVVIHESNALKKAQLAYYKMGDGPFYVFYTPFHLPHLQIASTIGRAALAGDATVAALDGPRCEVVTMAKRDLAAGERLDGIGGFTSYGLVENAPAARAAGALPMGLSEGCMLRHAVAKDHMLTAADVTMPAERPSDTLWREQAKRWPGRAAQPRAFAAPAVTK